MLADGSRRTSSCEKSLPAADLGKSTRASVQSVCDVRCAMGSGFTVANDAQYAQRQGSHAGWWQGEWGLVCWCGVGAVLCGRVVVLLMGVPRIVSLARVSFEVSLSNSLLRNNFLGKSAGGLFWGGAHTRPPRPPFSQGPLGNLGR